MPVPHDLTDEKEATAFADLVVRELQEHSETV
jgi:hypothetical protein